MNAPASYGVFKIDHLSVTYRGQDGSTVTPLRDLSLTIGAGEITCLLGPSGGGKTTLLKALAGFLMPDPTGGVIFDGRFLAGPTRDIVMVFQDNNLFPWLTVRQNVAFGLRYVDAPRAEKAARLSKMLGIVGLAEAETRYPHQLSGGMRQRAAIARSLVIEPRVLLLDEPFSALDVTLRRRMQNLIRDIWATLGTSMVMVTHNVEEALSVGHRVIVLAGRPGTVLLDERCDRPEFSDRYSAPFLDLQRRIEGLIDEAQEARDERDP